MVSNIIVTGSCYKRYPQKSIKHSRLCLQHDLFVRICMLPQVNVLLITHLPILSIRLLMPRVINAMYVTKCYIQYF